MAVIIVAGGGGQRMGGGIPKQFRLLGGVPVLARTIANFAAALPGAQLVVALPAEHIAFWRNLAARFDVAGHTIVTGGSARFHSVRNALAAIDPAAELIAVQDGVRPLGSAELIRRVAAAAAEHGAAIPVVEVVDSLREIDGTTSRAVDRSRLRAVQTPQVFRAEVLRRAYEAAYCTEFTDDASVVERSGTTVFLCEGERQNLKITTPEDLLVAEALLAARENGGEDDGTEHRSAAAQAAAEAAGADATADAAGSAEDSDTPSGAGSWR